MCISKEKYGEYKFNLNLPWIDLFIAGLFGALITGLVMFFRCIKNDD